MSAATKGCIAAIGTFDGVHRGHSYLIDFLKSTARQRGYSSAVITFSNHPLEIIRPQRVPPTITPTDSKIKLLEKSGADRIIVLEFDEELRSLSALQFMETMKAKHGITALLLGYDTKFGHDRPEKFSEYKAIGAEAGVEIIEAPELKCEDSPVSSSRIRKAIANGEIELANRLTGHPFTIRGTVGKGKQLGRTIGFPTANITPDCKALVIPRPGVYAVRANIPGSDSRYGMLNIGYRPTVDNSAAPAMTIELHIIGFEGDLYGCQVSVELVSRLRDEQKFDSVDSLRRQLTLDKEAAVALLSDKDKER